MYDTPETVHTFVHSRHAQAMAGIQTLRLAPPECQQGALAIGSPGALGPSTVEAMHSYCTIAKMALAFPLYDT